MRFQFHRTRGGRVIWQLVGGNNRVLGVSPAEFDDLPAAARAAEAVRARVSDGTPEVVLDAPARWRWSVADPAGRPLAVAGRSYERRVDCAVAMRRFIETAAQAEVDPVLGRRGRFWRAVDPPGGTRATGTTAAGTTTAPPDPSA